MPKLMTYSKTLPYSYAPGRYPSHALLDARPSAAKRLLIHTDAAHSDGVAALVDKARAHGVRVETADHILQRISRKENCFAAVVFDKYESPMRGDAPHIVLHNPSDMGNLGTILRACLGFGLRDMALIRPAADVFDPRVVRASMGALFGMNVMHYDHIEAYRADHPGHTLYPFMLDGATTLAHAVKTHADPYTLVFGNEASGLPADFAAIGQPVRIPHSDAIDSLNLAVAVSIAAYAFTQEE